MTAGSLLFIRLMRLLVPFGRMRLPVAPPPIRNCENELNAFGPDTVPVVTVLTFPFVVTEVAVRPSGVMTVPPCANNKTGYSVITTLIPRAEIRNDSASKNECGAQSLFRIARYR